jgi:S-adenosylmethionine:tRNA ribosyltransferase-isomerase
LIGAPSSRTSLTRFELPEALSAVEPPEERGLARDQVRMLVADGHRILHRRFADLPEHLAPGDLVVVNTSGTIPAAIDGALSDGRAVVVHFSAPLDDGTWVVEIRPAMNAHGPVTSLVSGDRVRLSGDVSVTVLAAYPDAHQPTTRLWRATVSVPDVLGLLHQHGRAVTYGYVPGRWPLESYQTIFAMHPGSAEMPSAGRPFTHELVTSLVSRGIRVAPITLHTGLSSPEAGEPPAPERYDVPQGTADLVNFTRRNGGRIIATGTTVTRALETVADISSTDVRITGDTDTNSARRGRDADRAHGGKRMKGAVTAGHGWTHLVLGPDRPARVVDGLITGWHAPGASHLLLLEAVVGADLVSSAYEEAVLSGYLWHEFGDSCLLLPAR